MSSGRRLALLDPHSDAIRPISGAATDHANRSCRKQRRTKHFREAALRVQSLSGCWLYPHEGFDLSECVRDRRSHGERCMSHVAICIRRPESVLRDKACSSSHKAWSSSPKREGRGGLHVRPNICRRSGRRSVGRRVCFISVRTSGPMHLRRVHEGPPLRLLSALGLLARASTNCPPRYIWRYPPLYPVGSGARAPPAGRRDCAERTRWQHPSSNMNEEPRPVLCRICAGICFGESPCLICSSKRAPG